MDILRRITGVAVREEEARFKRHLQEYDAQTAEIKAAGDKIAAIVSSVEYERRRILSAKASGMSGEHRLLLPK
jgi:hypothetical protein